MGYSYKKALDVVSEWGIREGFEEITFDHNDISFIDWERDSLNTPSKIKIHGKYTLEIKVYVLLHELGHHQLRKNWGRFEKLLPVIAQAEELHNEIKYKRRAIYMVSCIEEEFKAWEEGYKLGEKLGIRINVKKWNSFKSKCLMSYMRYYVNLNK